MHNERGLDILVRSLINYRFFWLIFLYLSFLGEISFVASAPGQYCVEETRGRRLTGVEPYAIDTTKDVQQCIARCILDGRNMLIHCKSVVYGQISKRCQKYQWTAKESNASFTRTHETDLVGYYELLVDCPKKALISNQLDDKRRDDAHGSHRPLANKLMDNGPPAIAPSYQPIPDAHQGPPPVSHDHVAHEAFHGPQPPINQNYQTQPETYQVRPVGPMAQPCCSPPQQTSCCVNVVVQQQPCCPAPQPQPCCPAPQPQPCCPPPPQPQPCCPAPQPQPCCPAPQPQPCCPDPPTPPPPQWGPWSDWTQCLQKPCAPNGGGGDTVQTRTRQCQGYGNCAGEGQQHQPCGCLQGQWAEWGPPSTCSVTCGNGMQSRSRSCTVPGTCPGQDVDQMQCQQGPCCQWSDWHPADPCPQTCGTGGTTQRRRTCVDAGSGQPTTGCSGPDSEPTPCVGALPPCCQPWSQWGPCSCTCGDGTQQRSMTCEGQGPSLEQRPCRNSQPCCTPWTQWGSCQVVCGQGHQTRTRSCGNTAGGGQSRNYLGPNTLGLPTLPSQSQQGGCCAQQQSCNNGCSPNSAFYVQSGYGRAGRKRRSASKTLLPRK